MKKETKVKKNGLRNQKQGTEPRWVGQIRKIGCGRCGEGWTIVCGCRLQILTKVKYLT